LEYYGYAGKILRVDLSSGKVKKEPLSKELTLGYLGGVGIQYRLIYDLLRPGLDPYSADAPVIVGTGPLTGTLAPFSGKVFATAKVPAIASKYEKKHFVSSSVGGNKRFGTMLKNAGYDHVIITGKAPKPSYLLVRDDDIEICECADLWGKKGIFDTTRELSERHKGATGPAGVWAIGKAGENLVRHAHGVVDLHGSLGRNGIGAVLGAKNLKAVVTAGSRGTKVSDPKKFMDVADRIWREITASPRFMVEDASWVPPGRDELNRDLPPSGKGIRRACMACLEGCKTEYYVNEGRFAGERLLVSYYRLTRFFGRTLGLKHYGETVKLMNMVNDLGLDKQTMQYMLLFLTKLYERGVITRKDTGGLELKFGDFEAYISLLDKIVNRQDIGEAAAEGWYPLTERLGADVSADFEYGWPVVKGVTVMTDARNWGFTPTFAIAPLVTGPVKHRHGPTFWAPGKDIHRETYIAENRRSLNDLRRDLLRVGATEEEMKAVFTGDGFNAGKLEKVSEDGRMVCDMLGVCDACHNLGDPMRDLPRLAGLYAAATGIEITPAELKKRGEKACNLERVLNVREGFTREDDAIPSVWLQNVEKSIYRSEAESGHRFARGAGYLHDYFNRRLSRNDLHKIMDDYYDQRGWDIDRGIPTPEKLLEVGLAEFSRVVEEALNR